MGLAEILTALAVEGDEEVARITADRDTAVADIMHEARRRAMQAELEATTARDPALRADADVTRHRAALQVERRLQETREAILQDIMGRAEDRLSRYRRDPAYLATLQALLGECRDFLDEVAVVAVDPRDADLVRAALAALGSEAVVEPSLETWGGVVASNGRGVLVRNTLEDRLRRAEPEIRRQIGNVVPGLRGGDELRGNR